MKKKLFLLILILFPIIAFCQKKDITIYKNVYNYLTKNDLSSYKNIGVSDEVVFIEYSSFINKNTALNTVDSLNNLDNIIQFEPYFIRGMSNKIKAKKSAYNIIYFSKPYKNHIIVDFLHNLQPIKGSYLKATMFGSVRRFLFKTNGYKVYKLSDIEINNN